MKNSKTILIVAGEASGDAHAGALVKEIKALEPTLNVIGVGGTAMRESGAELIADISSLNVMGLTEIGGKMQGVVGVFFKLVKFLKESQPDLLILVDFPDFNLFLARFAKRYDVRVMYYISPQVWAWRRARTRTIAKLVDRMVVILPFEVDFYRKHGMEVDFVGHPLLDLLANVPPQKKARAALNILPEMDLVGILPGSRLSEVKKLLPVMLEAVELIRKRFPETEFVFPLAKTLRKDDIDYLFSNSPGSIILHEGRTAEVISACDILIAASGTVTLEAAIIGTPLVIIYKLSSLSYQLARRLIRIPHIGLVNLVAGERLAPELIQHEATPGNIAREVCTLLMNADRCKYIKQRFLDVKRKLGASGASRRAARIAIDIALLSSSRNLESKYNRHNWRPTF